MNTLLALTTITTALHGIIAGVSFDVALVKLPTRHRIGNIAYAAFARGNDLGNGKFVYPPLAIGGALLVFGTTAMAFTHDRRSGVLTPLRAACLGTVLHFSATAKAAPSILSVRNAPDDEASLEKKLDAFAFWHGWRAVFQVLTYFALLWAMLVIH